MSADRFAIERAVKTSALKSTARLVMMMLLTRMDARNRVIPARWQPSQSEIAKDCGLTPRGVRNALDELEAGGWITRHRPTKEAQQRDHEQTTYDLHLPPLVAVTSAAREPRSLALAEARERPSLELGKDVPQARERGSHKSSNSRNGQWREEINAVKDALREHAGFTADTIWAAQTRDMILEGREDVGDRCGYLVASIKREPTKYKPTPTPARIRAGQLPA